MYVFCVGMYRSGSTWVYNVAKDLYKECQWTGFLAHKDMNRLDQQLQEITNSPHATIKLHHLPEPTKNFITKNNLKIIFTYRDIRDVIASNKLRGIPVERSITQLSDTKYNISFIKLHDSLLLSYRTIYHDPSAAVDEITNHLGVEIFDKDEILKKYAKENLQLNYSVEPKEDKKTLLWSNHVISDEFSYFETVLSNDEIVSINEKFEDLGAVLAN